MTATFKNLYSPLTASLHQQGCCFPLSSGFFRCLSRVSPGAEHDVWGRGLSFAPLNLCGSQGQHLGEPCALSWASHTCEPRRSGHHQVAQCVSCGCWVRGDSGQCPQHFWSLVSGLWQSAEMPPVALSHARAVCAELPEVKIQVFVCNGCLFHMLVV